MNKGHWPVSWGDRETGAETGILDRERHLRETLTGRQALRQRY